MRVTGYKTAGHIELWLQDNHVPYFQGKKGSVFTTVEKLNCALDGIREQANKIEFG